MLDNNTILPFIFHPVKTRKTEPNCRYFDIDINIEDINIGCRAYIANENAPVIFYFHGNGETVADYDTIAPLYLEKNLNLILCTYRGYGWSTGEPRCSTFFPDALDCVRLADEQLTKLGYGGQRFVMGRSLGSAAAIEVAGNTEITLKGMILESGFADTLPLLQQLGCTIPQEMSEENGFGNTEKISTITMPTLILHGAKDSIIPIKQAEKLQAFSGARTKRFFIIPGADHNSLIALGGEQYFITISTFIGEITGEFSWRKRRKNFNRQQK